MSDRAIPPDEIATDTESLQAFVERVRACRLCVRDPIGKPLPHEPRPTLTASSTARILIAGQAPGLRVHESGLSFNDRSGDRLRDWMGIDRSVFYDPDRVAIAAMGFCFPGYDAQGSDLPPRRECAPTWRRPLMDRMPQIELVLAIGAYAQRWHLGELRRATMTETVAEWRSILEVTRRIGGRAVLPLPHPSWRNTGWLKRHPWFEAEVLPELKSITARLIDPATGADHRPR